MATEKKTTATATAIIMIATILSAARSAAILLGTRFRRMVSKDG